MTCKVVRRCYEQGALQSHSSPAAAKIDPETNGRAHMMSRQLSNKETGTEVLSVWNRVMYLRPPDHAGSMLCFEEKFKGRTDERIADCERWNAAAQEASLPKFTNSLVTCERCLLHFYGPCDVLVRTANTRVLRHSRLPPKFPPNPL